MRANSAQKLTRPGAGPAAEPPGQLTSVAGGMPPASMLARRFAARCNRFASRDHRRRHAASASARGPRPCSLMRSVRPTSPASDKRSASFRRSVPPRSPFSPRTPPRSGGSARLRATTSVCALHAQLCTRPPSHSPTSRGRVECTTALHSRPRTCSSSP